MVLFKMVEDISHNIMSLPKFVKMVHTVKNVAEITFHLSVVENVFAEMYLIQSHITKLIYCLKWGVGSNSVKSLV